MLPPISQFTNDSTLLSAPSHALLPAPPILNTPSWNEPNINSTQIPSIAPSSHPRQSVSLPGYPSPADSGFGSPNILNNGFTFGSNSSQMLPPMGNPSQSLHSDQARSPHNAAKRVKLSPLPDGSARIPRSSSYGSSDLDGHVNPSTPMYFLPGLANPLTPAASSVSLSGDHLDDRRISVSSLLSEEPSEGRRPSDNTVSSASADVPSSRRGSLHLRMISYSETEIYGHDRGYPDLDIPQNNDTLAISGSTPAENSDFDAWLSGTEYGVSEFGFRLDPRDAVFSKGGYYASPVPIKIPRKLEPLPATLSENPMNLLYFHHFLNHTAKILVPHDCPENPFKTVLPQSKLRLCPRSVYTHIPQWPYGIQT